MSGLAALLAGHTEPGLYRWHSAAHVDSVAHAVEHAGWRFCYLDGWTIEDKETFLKAVGAALDLPDGGQGRPLSESLAGVTVGDHRGMVVLWDGWSPLARADGEAFDEVLGAFGSWVRSADPPKVAVLLRGEGPELDIPELPDAPH